MSGEITISTNFQCVKGNFKRVVNYGTITIDQATQGGYSAVVSVGTAEEDLTVGDVGTLGYIMLRNLDTTNYVQWGPKSGGSMVAVGRLKPGETAGPFRCEPGITLRWVANTGACKVQVDLLES